MLAWAGGRLSPSRSVLLRRRTDRRRRTRAPTRPLRAACRASPGPLPFEDRLAQIALVAFPGAVPELAVGPGDPGDDAAGLDGAKNRPCLGIHLMDLPAPMLPHPQRPFGPREPRVTAAARRRDRREHTPGLRIDLLDAILGDLKQVLTVEGRSCVRGDINRAQHLATRRIEGVQLVSGSKPDVLAVERNPMHVLDTRKGSIFTEDLGCSSFHACILVTR